MSEKLKRLAKESRKHFVGQWRLGCNEKSSETFLVTLNDDGTASRKEPDGHAGKSTPGEWDCLYGEACIRWEGMEWIDVLRYMPTGDFIKVAYRKGHPYQALDNTGSATKL